MYINDVTNQVHTGCLISLYADDILMHLKISCAADFSVLQQNIDNVSAWISSQHMNFNATKCKYMVISRRRLPNWLDNRVDLMDASLERVSTFKYRGVWLNETLTWSNHIKEISRKVTRQAGMIYRCFYTVCSSNCLLQLYLSYVRPFLEYAAPVWDPHYATEKQRLEKVQCFALKMSSKR